MKIDEPKTPYAPHYDPSADEDDIDMLDPEERVLDAQGLVVDELDQNKAGHARQQRVREDDIPGLKLGEPEGSILPVRSSDGDRIVRERSMSNNSNKSEKHVVVGTDGDADDTVGDPELLTSEEAKKKHQAFEERRKRHYEMRDVKDLLGYDCHCPLFVTFFHFAFADLSTL
jgi:protein phosphatase inhibitor 2